MSCCIPVLASAGSADDLTHSTNALHAQREFKMPKVPAGKMLEVPAGDWVLGSNATGSISSDAEGPARTIHHSKFQLSTAAISNAEFANFVSATGYRSEAEMFGWSFVFFAQVHPNAAAGARHAGDGAPKWWVEVEGAHWRCPDGPGSDWRERADHPVVHVSWNDARAFAVWAGQRLPSEVEWEIAARGNLKHALYPWGDELTPNGMHRCNIWQGRFPNSNTGEDGYLATAPVHSYEPNGLGFYNMVGNTWEWTADAWSLDQPKIKAMRGGSYLCHESYCNRYRVSARTGNTADATSSHLGFRCASDSPRFEDIQ